MKNVRGKFKSLMALVLSFTILSGTVMASAETVEPRELGEDTILSDDFERLMEEAALTPQTASAEEGIECYSSAPAIGVTLSVGASMKYNDYSTKDYSLSDGTTAFCLEPSSKSPAAGDYVASRSNNQLLNAVMYYGYGGPGYKVEGKGMYYLLDESIRPYAYVLTHMALSYVYDGCSDSSDAFTGTNEGTKNGLKNIVSFIDTYKWEVPSRYQAYTFSTGEGNQAMGFGYYEPEGYAKLKKSSANTTITDDNACYSLEGATYGVYSEESCISEVATFTTDVNGDSNTVNLYPGTYWIKEKSAPTGYEVDDTVYSITVKDGETTTLEVSDEPLNDPVAITIEKVDKDTGEIAQGTASLAGAQFTIRYYDGYYDKNTLPEQATRTWVIETKEFYGKYITFLRDSYKVSGDEIYKDLSGNQTLPLGTITIEETKAPDGYLLDGAYLQVAGSDEKIEGLYVAQIQSSDDGVKLNGGNTFTISDSVISGGVKIQKRDYETGKKTPQGNATLEGAKFSIISRNDNPVYVKGKTYQKDETVMTIKTDENGLAATSADALPKGDYTIVEKTAPDGYLKQGVLEQSFSITKNGVIVDLTAKDDSITDKVIRGGVKIQKYDYDTKTNTPQGNATLKGAEIAIINESTNAVYVDGKSYAPGKTVMTLTTDESGAAATAADALPKGDYSWKETKAPTGYQLSGVTEGTFTIKKDGVIVDLTSTKKGVQDKVIRGGVKIQKRDYETTDNHPMGGATLEGAEFAIVNKSKNPVYVNGKLYNVGETVATITSDKNGVATTASDTFPVGDYTLVETKAPAGYLQAGVLTQNFSITKNGVIVDLTAVADSIEDQVKRGDFEVRKIDSKTQDSMAGVEFSLTNLATGETHNFTTDENGYYSSASSWNLHSYNTNKGGAEDGMWFGQTTGGKMAAVNDKLGALPYGVYSLDEIEGVNNAGKEMFHGLLYIRRNGVTVDLGNIENYGEEPDITIDTKARDAGSGSWYAAPDGENKIVDTVSLEGLVPGREYTVKGVLMDKTTKQSLLADGKEVTAEYTFTAEAAAQTIEMTFTFDGSMLSGKEVVAFETIYYRGVEKASHENLNDADQTVYFPAVSTNMLDAVTESHLAYAGDKMELIDYVSYEGLQPGREYTMKGVLMDKDTGEALLTGEEEVTTEITFTPDEESGEVEMTFTFDGSALSGKTLVAYETCFADGIEIASHCDIADANQTVQIPEIGTTLTDNVTGSHMAEAQKKVTLTDKVSYDNLIPGKEYTVRGVLMNKTTGEALLVDGENVTAETTFIPDEASGSVEVNFTFDGSALAGKTVVAFETCYFEDHEIAVHADIEDTEQTVQFPEIGTALTDNVTGTHTAKADGEIALTDKVSYTNLIPGEEYTVKGILMDKETKEALSVDGKEVTAETVFTPEKASGEVEVTFTFDGSALSGKTLVAYETCYYGEEEIAVHRDIEDVEQTVQIPEIKTELTDHETETHVAQSSKEVTLTDKVSYNNLTPGEEYTMKGVLMDKTTGEALLINGKEVTAETVFTPEKAYGEVEVTFTFDGSTLSGKTLVAYETCYYKEYEVASHADIEDVNQTVQFPEIGTVLTDKTTGTHLAEAQKNVTLTDKVSYQNLVQGKEYTMKGVLMNKDTGKVLLVNGKKVTAETTFTPEKANGSVKVTFTFDGSALAGETVVAYETCYFKNHEIAAHTDLKDADQTVQFPKIGTELTDNESGTHTVQPEDKMQLTDKVSYKNLIPGKEYTMKGVLMDKETGETLLVNGEKVTAETTFIPEKESGSVELTFTFDGSTLAGKTVVAFETCYYEKKEVAVHHDIEDEKQSVTVAVPPQEETPQTPEPVTPKMGDSAPVGVLAGILLGGMALVGVSVLRKKKKQIR